MEARKIRVLMAKPGMDSHFRGAVAVSNALKGAGMEVIYIGNSQPDEIVTSAAQEDVDVIGLSILSSTYMEYIGDVTRLMRENQVDDKLLVVGGIIIPDDIPELKELGVDEVFPAGSSLTSIVDYFKMHALKKRSKSV